VTSPARADTRSGEAVLIVGATSGIGLALCRRFAKEGTRLVVAGRDTEALRGIAAEVSQRYETVVATEAFDALSLEDPEPFLDRCFAHGDGRIDGLLICHGYLPAPEAAKTDPLTVRRTIEVNFTSVASLLTAGARRLEDRRGSWIAAISSVAGDRGRRHNYVYGSAKGALSIFLQGLRSRLHPKGVHVLTIKPGFVDTPMLQASAAAGSRLAASPERVARDVHVAIRRRRDVLYTPWFWRPILFVIRLLPERIFKRLAI
jgi:decaprenylphospho-beta-D-erythro-pentofuranosid-2-ulose 2-reductase